MNNLPVAVNEILKDTESRLLDVKQMENTANRPEYSNRVFIEARVVNDDREVDLRMVTFTENEDWEFLDITYKNCTYQDLSNEKMQSVLINLLKGNLLHKRTLLTRKDKWVVIDDAEHIIASPNTIY